MSVACWRLHVVGCWLPVFRCWLEVAGWGWSVGGTAVGAAREPPEWGCHGRARSRAMATPNKTIGAGLGYAPARARWPWHDVAAALRRHCMGMQWHALGRAMAVPAMLAHPVASGWRVFLGHAIACPPSCPASFLPIYDAGECRGTSEGGERQQAAGGWPLAVRQWSVVSSRSPMGNLVRHCRAPSVTAALCRHCKGTQWHSLHEASRTQLACHAFEDWGQPRFTPSTKHWRLTTALDRLSVLAQ